MHQDLLAKINYAIWNPCTVTKKKCARAIFRYFMYIKTNWIYTFINRQTETNTFDYLVHISNIFFLYVYKQGIYSSNHFHLQTLCQLHFRLKHYINHNIQDIFTYSHTISICAALQPHRMQGIRHSRHFSSVLHCFAYFLLNGMLFVTQA